MVVKVGVGKKGRYFFWFGKIFVVGCWYEFVVGCRRWGNIEWDCVVWFWIEVVVCFVIVYIWWIVFIVFCGLWKFLGVDDWFWFFGRNVDFWEFNLSVEILGLVFFMCYRCVLKFEVVDGCFGDIYML